MDSFPPGMTASPARTVLAPPSSSPTLRGVTVNTPLLLRWPSKAPLEVLDYTLNLSAWLADGADSVSGLVPGVAPAADPYDLHVISWELTNSSATVLLANGLPDTDYLVSLLVLTQAGRTALFELSIHITDDTTGTTGTEPAPLPPVLPSPYPPFVYSQVVPAAVWFITHNLSRTPNVVVTDTAGNVVDGSIFYNSLQTLTLSFASAFAGTASLS